MPRAIPVLLGRPRMNDGSKFVDCPPVTYVHVSSEQQWSLSSGIQPKHNGELYPALIDTGCEATAISSDLAKHLSLTEASSKSVVSGFGGREVCASADIHIVVPSQNIVFSSRAAVTDLGVAGHTFAVVLGRSFLEHCRLEIDGPSNSYQLWWLP